MASVGKRRTKEQIQEYEANVFAVLLLMPTKFLLEEINKMGGIDLADDKCAKELCKKFEVTLPMLAFRLQLLTKYQKQKWKI